MHLILPDPHIRCNQNLDRMKWAAELILDVKPSHVICMGDFFDFESLHGKTKPDYGTVNAEVEVGMQAQDIFFSVLKKRKRKFPKLWMLIGNHDYRVYKTTWVEVDDIFDDKWELVPYVDTTPGRIIIDNIVYSHYAISGLMNRALATPPLGQSLLSSQHTSYTVGHSHSLSYATDVTADGRRIHGLSCGCYTEDEPEWAGLSSSLWWRGVVIKDNIDNGDYDLETIKLSTIRKEYE